MILIKVKFLILFFLAAEFSFSQKENNVWYFGKNAGLDFNSGTPVPLYNGQLNTSEGCATVSDAGGNLLFYTDGIKVWNKYHSLMPNGTGLGGNNSSTQSALIVQNPSKPAIYYLFTTDNLSPYDYSGTQQLMYSVVDIRMDNGSGDVTKKNILLHDKSCEKLTGIRHCNRKDIWVVTHDFGTNAFRAFLVDSTGVRLDSKLSYVGLAADGGMGNAIGQIKGSPDGKKLASAIEIKSRFELFDFNNSNGQVSNPILFPLLSELCYAVEFSPDGSKLYGVTSMYNNYQTPKNIYQFDLNAGAANDIAQSGIVIASTTEAILFGSLQLGPDKKIYVARNNQTSLGVINEPDKRGIDCNYAAQGAVIGGHSLFGLPNFVNANITPILSDFTVTLNCLEGSFLCPETDESDPVVSVSWDFGDPDTKENNTSQLKNPAHTFSKPGIYDVSLILHLKCRDNIVKQKVIIDPPKAKTTDITRENNLCSDKKPLLSADIAGKYLWNTGEQTESINAGWGENSYSVNITTSAGCVYTGSLTVTAYHVPLAAISVYGTGEYSSQLEATGGVLYSWYPAEGLSCTACQNPVANYLASTTYCVKVTDSKGCSDTSCVDVHVTSAYIPNTFTPNGDNLNDVFMPIVREVRDYHLAVFDRWGRNIFESDEPVKGWDGKYKDELCEEDVYAFRLIFTDEVKNREHIYCGKVTLIR